MDSLNRSLTNLQWLCDMRLNPVLSPNVQPGAAAPASCATAATITPAAPASAKPSACKPEMSYADLICVAMENSSKDGVTLNDIYTYISEHFPYYRKAEPSWKVRADILLLFLFDVVQLIAYANIFSSATAGS